jgi:hypothetical protein
VRLSVPNQDENKGLRTERQIALYRQREAAKRERAERREVEARAREAEARVRHLKFELVERVALLIMGVAIGGAVVIGGLREPALLKISLGAAGAWGVIAATLSRRRFRRRGADAYSPPVP